MMNVDFHSGHIETLCDLKTIAEKHNCKISFGVRSYSENIIDEGLLKQEGFTDDEINYIKDSLNVVDACTTNCSMYFELIEKDSNKVNSLVYAENSTTVIIDKDSCRNEYLNDMSDELYDKLEEHDSSYDYDNFTICIDDDPTIIRGFGNDEKITNHVVYRSGMALKYFGDYVCDYLGEPRIERVY